MHQSSLSTKAAPVVSENSELQNSNIPAELSKKMHFCRFLQKEINTVKTEAEKEAVHTILLKTKIQIRSLEREWKQLQSFQEEPGLPDSQKVANLFPSHN